MSKEVSYGQGPGIRSEDLVKEILQQAGWSVMETRKAADDGTAPVLEGGSGDGLRLPDFQAQHERHGERYVEVKSKREAIYYRIEKEYRHGYEKSQHEDYLKFREMCGRPVYIFIHERSTGVVLRQRLRNLTTVDTVTDKDRLQIYSTDDPIVLFSRENFETVVDDVSQFLSGFAQAGLLNSDVNISPFGLDAAGSQTSLGDVGKQVNSDDESTPRRRVAEIVRTHNTITVPELVRELISGEELTEEAGANIVMKLEGAGFLYLHPRDAPPESQEVRMP